MSFTPNAKVGSLDPFMSLATHGTGFADAVTKKTDLIYKIQMRDAIMEGIAVSLMPAGAALGIASFTLLLLANPLAIPVGIAALAVFFVGAALELIRFLVTTSAMKAVKDA